MPTDIRTHPDAPDREDLDKYLIEPVPASEIAARREAGERLVEYNVPDADDLDVYAELNPEPFRSGHDDVGTVLYRLVQLFGTPQFPEYRAGEDISHRTDTTFKYLFSVKRGVSDPDPDPDAEVEVEVEFAEEWLITVHDWHVGLGVSLAEWRPNDADGRGDDSDGDDEEGETETDADANTDAGETGGTGDGRTSAGSSPSLPEPRAEFDRSRALSSFALVYYVVTDSVQCVFADRWY